jgi:hypothetical protein
LAWFDGDTLESRAVFTTGPRPNGVAIVSHRCSRLLPVSATKLTVPNCRC